MIKNVKKAHQIQDSGEFQVCNLKMKFSKLNFTWYEHCNKIVLNNSAACSHQIQDSGKLKMKFWKLNFTWYQTLANWGPDLWFALEAIIKGLISKSKSSWVIKLMDRGRYYSSRVINPNSARYLTPNKGWLPSYFRITTPGRVICQNLHDTSVVSRAPKLYSTKALHIVMLCSLC